MDREAHRTKAADLPPFLKAPGARGWTDGPFLTDPFTPRSLRLDFGRVGRLTLEQILGFPEPVAPEGWTVEERGPVTLLLLNDELVATFVGNAGIHAPLVRNLLEANDEPDTHDCREDLPPALRAIPDVEVEWTKTGVAVRVITGPSGYQVLRHRDDLAVENPAAWRARAAVYLGIAQAIEDGPPPPPASLAPDPRDGIAELMAFAGEAGKVMEREDAERLWAAGARIVDDALVMRVEEQR